MVSKLTGLPAENEVELIGVIPTVQPKMIGDSGDPPFCMRERMKIMFGRSNLSLRWKSWSLRSCCRGRRLVESKSCWGPLHGGSTAIGEGCVKPREQVKELQRAG